MNKKYIKPAIKVKFVDTEQILAASDLQLKDETYEETQGLQLNAKLNNFNIWEDEDEDE